VLADGARVSSEFFLTAPHVAVVRVHSLELLGREFPLRPGGSVLRLVRINADVETVISGNLRPGAITFYGFAGSKEFRIYAARYVVFLREEAGVLRTMADPDGREIQVHTGWHDSSDLPDPRSTAARIMPCVHEELGAGDPIGMRVAYVLLTPGKDFNPQLLAEYLFIDVGRLLSNAPAQYVVWLLRQLQTSSEKTVRDAACIALAEYFPGADVCLTDLLNRADPTSRKRANELLNIHDRNAPTLIASLKSSPALLSRDTVDLAAKLQTLASHRDQQVRSLACRNLRNFFPACSFAECPTGSPKAGRLPLR
jgi:hypothetical protein